MIGYELGAVEVVAGTKGHAVEVTHCSMCPFSMGDAAEMCGADRRRRGTHVVNVDTTTPSWCPLRRGNVTVLFKEDK